MRRTLFNTFLWIIHNLDKISQIPCYERVFYFANIIEHLSINIINRQKHHQTEDIEQYKDIAFDDSVEKQADDKADQVINDQFRDAACGDQRRRDRISCQCNDPDKEYSSYNGAVMSE